MWEAFIRMAISIIEWHTNNYLQNIPRTSIYYANMIGQLLWVEKGGGTTVTISKNTLEPFNTVQKFHIHLKHIELIIHQCF